MALGGDPGQDLPLPAGGRGRTGRSASPRAATRHPGTPARLDRL